MKKTVYLNHVWALDSSSAPTSWLSNFAPASLVPGATTIDEIKFDVKIKTNPSPNTTDWHARLDFFPAGNNPGTWTASNFDRYINGDNCYWPTNDDASATIHYGAPGKEPPWRQSTGIVSITHRPNSNTHYLTNTISILAGMYAFGTPSWATMDVELVSVTITYNGFGLSWGDSSDRIYQTGVSRGIFSPIVAPPAVVWNGLVNVSVDHEIEREMAYYEGIPIHDVFTFKSVSGDIEAISLPAGFDSYGGRFKMRPGIFLHNQQPKRFHFCYRTEIGDSLSANVGYRLHYLYNVLAIPAGHDMETTDDSAEPTVHKLKFTTAPSSLIDKPPSSYLVIDSRYVDPDVFNFVEQLTYGAYGDPWIYPLQTMVDFLEP